MIGVSAATGHHPTLAGRAGKLTRVAEEEEDLVYPGYPDTNITDLDCFCFAWLVAKVWSKSLHDREVNWFHCRQVTTLVEPDPCTRWGEKKSPRASEKQTR
jgi:hypothetical protein